MELITRKPVFENGINAVRHNFGETTQDAVISLKTYEEIADLILDYRRERLLLRTSEHGTIVHNGQYAEYISDEKMMREMLRVGFERSLGVHTSSPAGVEEILDRPREFKADTLSRAFVGINAGGKMLTPTNTEVIFNYDHDCQFRFIMSGGINLVVRNKGEASRVIYIPALRPEQIMIAYYFANKRTPFQDEVDFLNRLAR